MTKTQLTLASLIAVLPAVVLIYLLVMVMLSHSENLSTMAYLILGGTLLSAGVTVLIPAGVWVGGKRKPKAAVAAEMSSTADDSVGDIEAVDDDIEASKGSSASFDAHEVLAESSEFDIGDSDTDMLGQESEAEIETDPLENFDDFDVEEEKPKQKKKKR